MAAGGIQIFAGGLLSLLAQVLLSRFTHFFCSDSSDELSMYLFAFVLERSSPPGSILIYCSPLMDQSLHFL